MHLYTPFTNLLAALLLLVPLALSFPEIGSRNTGPAPSFHKRDSNTTEIQQQIAIASYIDPGNNPDAWNRLIAYPNQKVSVLVANVLNGPDIKVNPAWDSVIRAANASGKEVLGYVRTGYLGNQGFKTRLGSLDPADWVAQIERDVDTWYELYGPGLGGIFFDEGWWDCGANNITSSIYKYLNDYTKLKYPRALTVLNPGSPVERCYENTMDTLLTFEGSYEKYTSSYQGLKWTPQDPRKIWHIVFNTPAEAIANVTELSNTRGAGFLQLTDDNLDNPYDNLPNDSYMQSAMDEVAGNVPLNIPRSPWPAGSAAGTPSGLAANKTDYSSTRLSWNAATNAKGYNIYIRSFKGQTNYLVASTPPTIRALTIGGLPSGTTLQFFARAIGGSGALSGASNVITVTTTTLPGGKSIINPVASVTSSSTIYKADVLIPYGFLRLFIFNSTSNGSLPCSTSTQVGWPIEYASGKYVCTKYFVEGSNLYKYAGEVSGTWMTWSWSFVGPVTVRAPTTTGQYSYNWTVPIGAATMDTSSFVVQGEGLGPFINVFKPVPA
ncbi:Spherulation-specific family 4 domain containing protein [Naviculisporaceae sp. PSN 640]